MDIKKSFLFVVILSIMMSIGSLASDIYLPSMPIIAKSLNTLPSRIQQTFSIYLLGLSLCQLFYGPFTDRFGKKRMLFWGIIIFIVSSLFCAKSHTLSELITARFFQSLGACSGIVVGRASIGALFTREEAAKILTIIFPIVGLSPAVAPFIGGYLSIWFGWTSTFYSMVILGLILLWLVINFFPADENTLFQTKQKTLLQFFKYYGQPIKNFSVIIYIITICSSYAAYFSYLVASPFVFSHNGFSIQQIGYFYISLSFFYLIGNILGRRISSTTSIDFALGLGVLLLLTSSISLIVSCAFIKATNPLGLIIPASFIAMSNGFLLPLAVASIVTIFPKISGTVSGFIGFSTQGAAALAAALVGHFTDNQGWRLALFIFCISIIGTVAFSLLMIIRKRDITPILQRD